MSSTPSSKPLVFVALDGGAPLLPSVKSGARGRLQLEKWEQISPSAIADNFVLKSTLQKTKQSGGRVHLFGLVSEGGMSSHLSHLYALIDAAKAAEVRVLVHAFLDGVDVRPGTAADYISGLEVKLEANVPGKVGAGRIGTISGRTFGMAPEGRSERTEKVFRAVMADDVERKDSALSGIKEAGGFGVPEQFFAPFVVFDYPGVALIDSAIHFNFAADGARELSAALTAPTFDKFARKQARAPFSGRFTCMTPYEGSLVLPTLFPRAPDLSELPVDVLAAAGYKAANCSQGPLPTIVNQTTEALKSGKVDFILADFANPGNAARPRAGAVVDAAVQEIVDATRAAGGAVFVLGGADAAGSIPVVYLGNEEPGPRLRDGATSTDLAATLLDLMGVPKPEGMDGVSLFAR
jgi:2,3-bisphosphoglycerate-independent phosphoglycerate mutase